MRLRNVKNKEIILNESKFLIKDPFKYKSSWNELFGNNNPIYIEIGMGKGKFIIDNAINNPDVNYIGIEKFDSVIVRALEKVPENISNLYMIRMDALDIDKIFSNEVDLLYLNFSDPWPKNRHSSRRLTSSVFLEKYDKIFKNKPLIEMRTDNYNLFLYSLISFSEFGYVFKKLSFNLHNDDMPEFVTEYEEKFSKDNMPIYYVMCRKEYVKKCKN